MNYQKLAGESRVWIYQSSRNLANDEVAQIMKYGQEFIDNWAAHGADLRAAIEIFHNRFIVLFADESQVQASGCSIDSSVHFMKKIQEAYGIDLFDRLDIAFRTTHGIDTLRMNDFQTALSNGQLSEETLVFNNLVENKSDFESKWEVPVKESWHQQLL